MSVLALQSRGPLAALTHRLGQMAAAIGTTLVRMGETHPLMISLRKLNEISDEELAERGLDRNAELHRIVRRYAYV